MWGAMHCGGGGVKRAGRQPSRAHPCPAASFSIFQPSSYHLVVSTAFGLRLQIQLAPLMQLFLTLDQAAQGRVQGECPLRSAPALPLPPAPPHPCSNSVLSSGLCGNFNGQEGDDFQTAGGLVEATGAGFANTWKAQSSCQDKQDWLDDPCSLNIESGERPLPPTAAAPGGHCVCGRDRACPAGLGWPMVAARQATGQRGRAANGWAVACVQGWPGAGTVRLPPP